MYDSCKEKIEQINKEYQENGITFNLVRVINEFTSEQIEADLIDEFWSDSARKVLGLLIIVELNNEGEVKIDSILSKTSFIDVLQGSFYNKLDKIQFTPELKEFESVVSIINSDRPLRSDKPLHSVFDILKKWRDNISNIRYDILQKEKENNIKQIEQYIEKSDLEIDGPEAKFLKGKYFWEEDIESEEGLKLMLSSANQGYGLATEKISEIMNNMYNKYYQENPEDVGFGDIFKAKTQLDNEDLIAFIARCNGSDKIYMHKPECFVILQNLSENGNQIAQKAVKNIIADINTRIKNQLTEDDLKILDSYSMNENEKNKIKELNHTKDIKAFVKIKIMRKMNNIKYIDGMGYMYIYSSDIACAYPVGIIHVTKLKLGPIMDINEARKEFKKLILE